MNTATFLYADQLPPSATLWTRFRAYGQHLWVSSKLFWREYQRYRLIKRQLRTKELAMTEVQAALSLDDGSVVPILLTLYILLYTIPLTTPP